MALWLRLKTIAIAGLSLAAFSAAASCSDDSESNATGGGSTAQSSSSSSGGGSSSVSSSSSGSSSSSSGQGGSGGSGLPCNGADLMADPMNCGTCGNVCPPGITTCNAGACECPPNATATLSGDVQPIFNQSCGGGGGTCHFKLAPSGMLSLKQGESFGSLVNSNSFQCASKGGRKFIEPGDPGNSYLIDKLQGIQLCSGVRMPSGAAKLPDATIETIVNWVCAGAPNN